MNSQELAIKIEALLFSEGEPVTRKRLISVLGVTESELALGIATLQEALKNRGVAILQTETEVGLAITPNAEATVTAAHTKDLERDIGDAGLEVLAILLYHRAATRADIDYIRGVNSSFTIRAMLARGLIERIRNPGDSREFLYRPTVELLAHLGVTGNSDLPDHATISLELKEFEQGKMNQNAAEPTADSK